MKLVSALLVVESRLEVVDYSLTQTRPWSDWIKRLTVACNLFRNGWPWLERKGLKVQTIHNHCRRHYWDLRFVILCFDNLLRNSFIRSEKIRPYCRRMAIGDLSENALLRCVTFCETYLVRHLAEMSCTKNYTVQQKRLKISVYFTTITLCMRN